MKPFIYIDNQELTHGTAVLHLFDDAGVVYKSGVMATGDYMITDDIVIERKTEEDMLNSLFDGRLLDQCKRLKNEFKKPLIILEKSDRIVDYKLLEKLKISISISWGIPILESNSLKHTVLLLKSIAIKYQKKKEYKPFKVQHAKKDLSLPDNQRLIIESLPGISAVKGLQILKECKTIKNIVNTDDLTFIDGIGKILNEKIQKVLNTPFKEK
jgi:Fanconi anemia group M protein